MDQLSRRSFIKATTAVVAAAGAATAVPFQAAAAATRSGRRTGGAVALPDGARLDAPVVAQLRDLSSGEIGVFVGTREAVLHDRDVASRIFAATRRGR